MKSPTNKYAQLVEAQSPEPPADEPQAKQARSSQQLESADYYFTEQASRLSYGDDEHDDEGRECDKQIKCEERAKVESGEIGELEANRVDHLAQFGVDLAPNSIERDQRAVGEMSMEATIEPMTTSTKTTTTSVQSGAGEAADKKLEARKESQGSSQMSTSFILSSLSSSPSVAKLSSGQQVAKGGSSPQSSGRGETTRSVSQSILDGPLADESGKETAKQNPSILIELDKFTSNGGGGGGSSSNGQKMATQKVNDDDESRKRRSKFQVVWQDLTYKYEPNLLMRILGRKACRQPNVLNNLSGGFKSNKLIAIIGPSGCGKTTLLHFLAGNNAHQSDRLKIIGLDEPKVAFIGQDDCLLPGLTAQETLIYASRLQNSGDNKFNHAAHIEPILEALGLKECADRSVTKLSGGQMKRVTIAQELLYPTNLLILDEITSGLDASTSYSIVKLLKQLVSDENGYPMSIVMSIHQPSARLFSVFDQVYLMSEGSCLYEGSCKVESVNSYLREFGLECPNYHNIADYLIEIASDDSAETDHKSVKARMIKFQQKRSAQNADLEGIELEQQQEEDNEAQQQISNSKSHSANLEHDRSIIMPLISRSLYQAIEIARAKRSRPYFSQFGHHFARSLLRIQRSHILTYLQFLTYIFIATIVATFYGQDIGLANGCPRMPTSLMAFIFSNDHNDNSQSSEMPLIQENMNLLLVATLTITFAALEITVITFPLEAKTVRREWRNGWYKVSSYFMGRTLADLPFQLVFVISFCSIIYSITGQIGLGGWRFVTFTSIMVMIAMIAQSIGFVFGAIFMNNLPAAVFTAPLCCFPALLFSGFLSRVTQVPLIYKPLTYISHLKYGFDSLLVTLYGFDRCHCDQDILQAYHDGLINQTSTMKVMFNSLFGSSECEHKPANVGENSIEDEPTATTTAITVALSTTPMASLPKQQLQHIEDALVESVFEHMKNTSAINGTSTTLLDESHNSGDAMDMLSQRFATRITSVLNRQANFGRDVPKECNYFNSYLMAEFDLHNHDLIYGISMLFLCVIMYRLVCQIILTFTIARRST